MENIIKKDIDKRKPKYRQSANALFNFMKQMDYLKEKLKNKEIVPRYVLENVGHLKIMKLISLQIPMICFCDINLHKVSPHASVYGYYGIAFTKEFCLKKSVQPINYINEESDYFKSFCNSLNWALNNSDSKDCGFEMLTDHIVKSMMFMKPLEGPQDGDIKNFHDEQEWRYVPDLKASSMKQLMTNHNKDELGKYNEALKKVPDISFKFNYSDIKYLIIHAEEERPDFINWIMQLKEDVEGCTDEDCLDLISKIRVFETIEEDA